MAAINFITVEEHEPIVLKLVTKPEKEKRPARKPKGKSSEVFAFQVEDMKKIAEYFQNEGRWLPYMIFVLSCNMARRIGDTMSLTWEHFYNPKSGVIRDSLLEIVEDKTDKFANPRINQACRDAINKYIAETGCNPASNGYKNPICLQLSGTHKGTVMSESGYYKALKNAAARVGIEYNVGTHSTRKTFGAMSRTLHPHDNDSMELLQSIFNHNDTRVTSRYIGLTKQKADAYYDDMGEFFNDYVVGDKEFKSVAANPVVSIETADIRELIKIAYEAGMKNAAVTDPMEHVNAISEILAVVESIAK